MFEIGKNTYIDRGYLIEVDENFNYLKIKLTKENSILPCFEYSFKLYGTYQNQKEDLIDDCIDMYERKNKIY
jgi:hypothetical protein